MSSKPLLCMFFGLMLFFGGFVSSQMAMADLSFSLKFGTSGSGDGKFNSPSGLALDTSNNLLYIADTDNNRIQIIDVDGNCSGSDELANDVCFVDEFGGSGTGDGKFDSPTALVLDTDNDLLYIADSGNDRIQIIDVDGNCSGSVELANDVCFVDEFGVSGDDDGEFDFPSGLAFDPSTDYLYIADTGNNRIQIIDVDGNCGNDELANDVCFVDEFGGSGNGEGDFDQPSALALDTDNDMLYVADTDNNLIQIIDVDGNCSGSVKLADKICFVDEFGGSGSGDGDFDLPSGLALDLSNDILYVADTDNNRIQIIDVDGNCSGSDELANDVCFVDEFGGSGTGDGKFKSPSGLAINSSDDLMFVADSENNRIQLLNLEESKSSNDAPSKPANLKAYPVSTSSIFLTWDLADSDEDVTGYKIEAREGSENFAVIVADTKSDANSFVHGGLSDSETYSYRIYAINAHGTSPVSSSVSEKPEESLAPAALTATAISPSQIKLRWFPPTQTFQQSISGYTIERVITNDVYDEVGSVGSQTTSFTVNNLQTDKSYSFAVKAKYSSGSGSPRSNTASATPLEDSREPSSAPSISTPSAPNLTTKVISESQIDLSWSKPSDGGSPITGYRIEVKENSGSYSILIENTKSDSTSYSHTNLKQDTKYTYKVSAINGIGIGTSSNESSAIPVKAPNKVLTIKSLSKLTIDEGKRLAFTVGITDNSINDVRFSLGGGAPSGATIDSNTGSFSWTPSKTQSGNYSFDIIAKSGSMEDRETASITVHDVPDSIPEPTPEPEPQPEPEPEPQELGIASFVDKTKDPQYYVDRYNNEPKYKEWFDSNYPEYDSIYQAVGLKEPKGIAAFVDPSKDPQYYVDRYNNEPKYKEWFDSNFPEYDSIYQAVGLEESEVTPPKTGECGEGTELVDGVCTPIDKPKEGGGCLIATAAYGSEMAPQVQFLREIRDGKVMSTESGASFMAGFNQFYYSFSPTIADYERENPMFKEAVKVGLTPMLSSLSILSFVDINSEQEMLGYGIAIIMANIGMYFVAPAVIIYSIKRRI